MTAAPKVGGVRIELDPKEWAKFKQKADAVDRQIVIELRRRLRAAGQTGADRVIKTLGMPSPDDGPDEGLRRQLLAAATKTTVSFAAKRGSVKIATSDRLLPQEHKGLLKVYNMERFRHPVFERKEGARSTPWVEQQGRPYMGKDFMREMRKEAIKEINDALRDAVRKLDSRP